MTLAEPCSAVLFLTVLAIAAITACSLAAAAPSAGQADGTIRIPLPESDVAVTTDADGFGRFTGTDIQQIGQTGEPSIPCQSVRVLLPPDADPATVKATDNRPSVDRDRRRLGHPACGASRCRG